MTSDKRDAFKRRLEQRKKHVAREKRLLLAICDALKIDADVSRLRLRLFFQRFDGLIPNVRFFAIAGGDFERPGSSGETLLYGAFLGNDSDPPFVELTPRNSAIGQLLAANFDHLQSVRPTVLADLILTMQLIGSWGHKVLSNLYELHDPRWSDDGFVLSDEACRIADSTNLSTSMTATPTELTLQALTLYGWMHETHDLGMTEIIVRRSGELLIADRRTICDRTFSTIPVIWY